MITNTGKTLVSKYLTGQAPAYASYLAIGCGSTPLSAITFSVTNVALSGSTVTITTSAAHNFTTSDYVTIKDVGPYFDGVYPVASVPGLTSFTYTITNPLTATTGLVATLTSSSGFITLTTGSTTGLIVGQTLTKTSGTGALGTNTVILSIPSSTTMVVSVAHATSGSTTFSADAAMNIAVSPSGTATKNYSTKTALDFEMARFPIISPRGYVTENNISKIVLSGEIPLETRYEITEIGIFSAETNPSAISNDSKTLYNFDTSEGWQYYNGTSLSTLSLIQTSLDDGSGNINSSDVVFLAGADNVVFSGRSTRLDRQERPRFGVNTYFLRGDFDKIPSASPGSAGSVNYLQITNNTPLDLSQNSSNDEIRLAFSVVSKTMLTAAPAGNVVIKLRLIDNNAATSDMDVNIAPTISTRYQVASVKLSAFTTAAGFNWSKIAKVQIYASVYSSGTTTLSTDHYIALDAIRLENVSTTNSLYGLTGYSPVVNTDSVTGAARPIVKEANVPNLAEFRFIMDVT